MGIYGTGYFISFFIGILKVLNLFSELSSQKAQNMKKIGAYYNLFSGRYDRESRNHFFSITGAIIYLLLIAPLFSWLSVASAIFIYIKNKQNFDILAKELKEMQYKLSSTNLEKQEVINLNTEYSKFMSEQAYLKSSVDEGGDPYTLILESDGWYSDIQINPTDMKYKYFSHSEDYTSAMKSTYKYKIEGDNVYEKALDLCFENPGKNPEYQIQDNVVLESELNKKKTTNNSVPLFNLEERVNKLNEMTEWRPVNPKDVKYFIISHHPEILTKDHFRKIVRSDKEEILKGINLLKDYAVSNGLKIEESDEGLIVLNSDEKEKNNILDQFCDDVENGQFVLSFDDFMNCHSQLRVCEKWLRENKPLVKSKMKNVNLSIYGEYYYIKRTCPFTSQEIHSKYICKTKKGEIHQRLQKEYYSINNQKTTYIDNNMVVITGQDSLFKHIDYNEDAVHGSV